MSDPKLVDCPACSAPALKKQVTAAAFKLKGTGWYETDFKNSGKKPDAGAKKTNDDSASGQGGDRAASKKSDSATDSTPSSAGDATSSSSKAAVGATE